MIRKPLEQIELADLAGLVCRGVREGKTIEYKETFYQLDHADKIVKVKQHEEMLKDISSFANAQGGDLIIGIKDNGAVPWEVCGFDVKDKEIDKLKRRILDVVENGIDPRIGIDIHSVPAATDRHVFVIRVEKSVVPPHRVVYQNVQGQFWTRTSSGCTRMDATQIRLTSSRSVSFEEQIDGYRAERVAAIKAGRTPLPLKNTPKLVCHLIPQDALGSRISLSVAQLESQLANLPLLVFAGGWSPRANLEGLLISETAQVSSAEFGYVQVKRNGIIEAVASDATTRNRMDPQSPPHFSHDLVRETIRSVGYYLKAYAGLGIAPPAYCFLSLIGVKGMWLYWPGLGRTAHPVEEDDILLPPVLCESYREEDRTELLRPSFDLIWNAGGLEYCPLFKERS